MSKKADLLVRVRYQNKLPPPPFPPRLLHIPTDPQRYARYEFLNPLNSERELPMIVDGELGMPMELGKIPPGQTGDGQYWLGDRDAIAPPPGSATALHDDDLALLADTASSSSAPASAMPGTPGSSATMQGMGIGERKKVDVSWLRRTEYLSSEGSNKPAAALAALKPKVQTALMSDEDRVKAIADSFEIVKKPLSELRHPSKPHLRAESAYDVLPDSDLWANDLNFVRFGEDPGEQKGSAGRAGADPRLPRALFRPIEIPDEPGRIGYYLPEDTQTAAGYELRRSQGADGVVEGEEFSFRHVRDYEVATTRPLHNEFVFCFEDGDLPENDEDGERPPAKRPRGAYFTPVGEAQTLRKRRPKRGEDPTQFPDELVERGVEFWDGISLQVVGLETMGEELRQREKALKVIEQEPGEADAEDEDAAVSRDGDGGSKSQSPSNGVDSRARSVEVVEA